MPERVTAFAPGRVNLIGEHTDYNGGLALPFSIELGVTVRAVRARGTAGGDGPGAAGCDPPGAVSVSALDLGESDRFRLHAPEPARGWRAFARGAAAELAAAGVALAPARLEVTGTVPRGAGLASSGALSVALCLALAAVADAQLPEPLELARICSRIENRWVGAQTGLLDPLAAMLGRCGQALLIDFRTLTTEPVPLRLASFQLVTLDSGERHLNAGPSGGYGARRRECRRACELLGVGSLSDADPALVGALPEPLRSRALHVLGENERVREAVQALRAGDPLWLGSLLDRSHESLRDLYGASTPAVERAIERLHRAGAVGARLIGGGFGGHVLGLLPGDARVPRDAVVVAPGPGVRVR